MPRPHSNSRVDRAGNMLAVRDISLWPEDRSTWNEAIDTEYEILDAWRAIHALPLHAVSRQLAIRTQGLDKSAIFSQRLKRYPAIRQKLQGAPNMQLTTMQDIAGCRAVVGTIEQAYALKRKYEEYALKRPASGHELIDKWTKDYILKPKEDGYRSIHLVLRFRTQVPKHSHCNGLRVEVQIRSRSQHAWATAVETASAVTNQALKSGEGEEAWKRFFKLMGDFIAMREECPLLTTTFENEAILRREAAELAIKLRVIPLLEGMRHVIEHFQSTGDDDYYLLVLDSQRRSIRYEGYKESDFPKAKEAYSREERAVKDNSDVQVVLVRVASIEELREAYPSYFLDSTNFVTHVKQIFSSK
jgi:putative GTP pyrophosphokinase